MNRKEFIKSACLACFGGALFVENQSCTSVNHFVPTVFENSKLVLKKSEFVLLENGKTIVKKYVLLKTEQHDFPICVYKIDKDNYTALSTKCTHNACEIKPQGDFLICPCHGSEFTNQGVVLNPPAEENLQSFKISTDDENIYLHF